MGIKLLALFFKVTQGALVKEAALRAVIRLNISIAVPDMRILKGPPLYSVKVSIWLRHLSHQISPGGSSMYMKS
jgi:hypothetical protein